MRRTETMQKIRIMRFYEACGGWKKSNIAQAEAAQLLGVCERTFRRYINRYEDKDLEGLFDKRLSQASHRRAPLDEVLQVTELYSKRHRGWNVKHFKREKGTECDLILSTPVSHQFDIGKIVFIIKKACCRRLPRWVI